MGAKVFSRVTSEAIFQDERFSPVVLAEGDHSKVVLVCFKPGQFIPVHTPGVDLTLIVLEGEGKVMAGEKEYPIGPQGVVFVPAGEARGILAETKLVALHVVSPPPTQEDHREVMEGLKSGVWKER